MSNSDNAPFDDPVYPHSAEAPWTAAYSGPPSSGYAPPPSGYVPAAYWQAPPPRRGRRGLVVGAATAAAVVAAGAIALDVRAGSGGTHTVSAPASFAGYQRLHNARSDRVDAAIRAAAQMYIHGDKNAAIKQIAIASYAVGGSQDVVLYLLAMPTEGLEDASSDAADRVDFLAGPRLAATLTPYPSAGSGTSLQCGITTFGSIAQTVCVWSDGKTSGAIYRFRPAGSPGDLATTTEALRATVDR